MVEKIMIEDTESVCVISLNITLSLKRQDMDKSDDKLP